jgi:glycine hydroxymethyltransferase
VSGKEAEEVLDSVGITLNKNAIADDSRKPMDPSGIRFGTPAITTRGFKEQECARVAELMLEALKNRTDPAKLEAIHQEIKQLCARFPIPESFI